MTPISEAVCAQCGNPRNSWMHRIPPEKHNPEMGIPPGQDHAFVPPPPAGEGT